MGFHYTLKSRWPEELTVKFMELYQQYECLWNIHNPEYKDRNIKRLALENIAANVGIEGFGINDVRQKIKNLRSTYQQELQKIEKSKIREDGAPIHVPNMKWFSIMHEVMAVIKNNYGELGLKDKVEVKSETKHTEDPEDEFEEQFYEYLEDDLTFEDSVLKNQQELTQQNEDTSSSSQATVPKDPISPLTEVPQSSSNNTNFPFVPCGYYTNSRKKKLQDTSLVDESSPPEKKQDLGIGDECVAFGNYIGLSLKKLPVELSIQAQQELQETITRYRLLAMKTTSTIIATTSKDSSL